MERRRKKLKVLKRLLNIQIEIKSKAMKPKFITISATKMTELEPNKSQTNASLDKEFLNNYSNILKAMNDWIRGQTY